MQRLYCNILALLILLLNHVREYDCRKTYRGSALFAIPAFFDDEWTAVTILSESMPDCEFDVWREPVTNKGKPGYVLIPNECRVGAIAELKANNIDFNITINDIESLIERSAKFDEVRMQSDQQQSIIDGHFPRYNEVVAWMQNMSANYPQLASFFSIGQTTEGRPMNLLKLGLENGEKWRVWIDAGLHAREWLAPTTAIYITDRLLEGYVNGIDSILEILQFFDFYIMPVANPDGYEFCHTSDRLWRKNRRIINANCTGVDLNRNFNFEWGGINADDDPCSNLYMGPYPESEIEVLNIVNFILPESHKYLYYHAFHTWGELFFTRWDFSSTEMPPDHQELIDLAIDAVNSINHVNGEMYYAGTAPDLMYAFAGSSSDWARGVANIKYAYLTELRDDDGEYGFVAPPEEIEPCGKENWLGFQATLVNIMEKWKGTSPTKL